MNISRVKSKLAKGEPVLCASNHFFNPNLVEMIGLLGFDCVWLCNEHLAINPESMENLVRAARSTGMDPMVRIAPGSHADLLKTLEMGAKGLMIPRVRSQAEARKMVLHSKFYPIGERGVDGVNADSDMGTVPLKEYCDFANENNFLVLQIEDGEAVEKVFEIASTKGVDILFVGPLDLSFDFGIPGEIRHPRIRAAIERTVRACEENGIVCGSPGIDPEYGKGLLDMGVRFLTGPGDYGILRRGFESSMESWGKLGFRFGSSKKEAMLSY